MTTANDLLREVLTCAGEVLNAHEVPPDTNGPLAVEPGDSNDLSLAKAALLLHDLAVNGEFPDDWQQSPAARWTAASAVIERTFHRLAADGFITADGQRVMLTRGQLADLLTS